MIAKRDKEKLRVLLAFDVEGEPATHTDYEHFMATESTWFTEGHILAALRENGHEVGLMPILRHPQEVIERIASFRPDVIWNSVETIGGNRYYESHLIALLELLHIPFTGNRLEAVVLCKDKGVSKRILASHGVQVPRFVVAPRGEPLPDLPAALFPAIVKPLSGEGSEGIAGASLTRSSAAAHKRVEYLHRRLRTDAIIERFIDGREIYVAVLGTQTPRVLPPRELKFTKVKAGVPTYASHTVKWDVAYRKRWGIRSEFARRLSRTTRQAIAQAARKTYRALHMHGYGRIDIRLRPDGEVFVLEGNPNPEIAMFEDLAESAAEAGLPYNDLIEKVLRMAFDPV